MFALMLPVLLGMSAIVVDLGNVFVEKRSLQKAADAAALAAAQRLTGDACPSGTDPGCKTAVSSLAGDYSGSNLADGATDPLPECDLSVTTNCYRLLGPASAPGQVEVNLTKDVSTFFGGLIGRSSFAVNTRAVAARFTYTSTTPGDTVVTPESVVTTPDSTVTNPGSTVVTPGNTTPDSVYTTTTTTGGQPQLVFTKSSDCTALKISGQQNVFHGAIQSNGGVDIHINNTGDVLIWNGFDASHCFKDPALATKWGQVLVDPPPDNDWPVPVPTYAPGTPGTVTWEGTTANCTLLTNGTIGTTLAPGLYCINSPITISAGVSLTNVGLVGTKVQINNGVTLNGGYQGLMPEHDGLLFLATAAGSNAIQFKGADVTWTGGIFAPNGDAKISGAGGTIVTGFIEADTVDFSGCCATWYGTGPALGTVTNITVTTVPGTTTPGNTTIIPPSTVTNPGSTTTYPGYTTTDPDVVSTTGTGSNLSE